MGLVRLGQMMTLIESDTLVPRTEPKDCGVPESAWEKGRAQ